MRSAKLTNPPLKEAIFELFWDSPLDPTGFPEDKEFEFALGKFDDKISKAFPVKKRKFPSIPEYKVYGKPVYQFWKGNIEWPIIQLGPGVLTVNDTDKNYEWAAYRPNVIFAVNSLLNSYSTGLNFSKVTLKYIDSVDTDAEIDFRQFIKNNLQTNLENNFKIPGQQMGLNVTQSFRSDDSNIIINIQNATNNITGKKAIIWMTTIERSGNLSSEEIFTWIDQAHAISSDLFVQMLNPDFHATFCQ